jgi:Protein of unknown function (DUF2778)
MWKYSQSTGNLTAPDGTVVGQGYSGNTSGLDNPAAQDQIGVGPIPQGSYTIRAFFNDLGGKGPMVAHLMPDPANEMYGRSGFMIHGDNPALNHTASDGCIILSRPLREVIASSSDRELMVTA